MYDSSCFPGEKGWIFVGRKGVLQSHPKELLADWRPVPEDLNTIDLHHKNWIQAIRTRQQPIANAEVGAGSTIVAHLGNIAYWTGRALRWDPIKEEFEGDDEANRMRSRAMREPWTI